ncbi:MAG TPA: hypothetical protein DC042_09425 [Bacteroidales bacterium]|nr:hypothetical protein [Bacteroidales bacterium]
MQKIDSSAGLRNAIIQLEIQRADEERMIKEQAILAVDRLKPINLIKSAFKSSTESPVLSENIFSTSVGLTAGYISKLLFQSVTRSPVKKLIGTLLMFGVTKVIMKNPDAIKSFGNKFLKIFKKKP